MATDRSDSMGAYEAKTHFSELIERVERGEEVTITKHGTPVARIVPLRKESTPADRSAAIERALVAREKLSLGKSTIRALIREGRR